MILVNSSQGGDCWSFGVALSAPMVYDEVGGVCMYVYDDVGVIMGFLMSCSTHTVACLIEPVGSTRLVSILICRSTGIQNRSTKAVSLDRSSEGTKCTLFSCAISFTGMF